MKSIILIALAVVAVAVAAPADSPVPPVEIIEQINEQQPDGSFVWRFKTSDGTFQEQIGELKETVDENKKPIIILILRGSYSYVNDKGETDTITYDAGEEGYKPVGESIPKPVEAVEAR